MVDPRAPLAQCSTRRLATRNGIFHSDVLMIIGYRKGQFGNFVKADTADHAREYQC
jgi:hypothetical protein